MLKQLRTDLLKIFELGGIEATKVQLRNKRTQMIIDDRMFKGDIAPHAKIQIGDEEFEWVHGEINWLDPQIFDEDTRNRIFKLGF